MRGQLVAHGSASVPLEEAWAAVISLQPSGRREPLLWAEEAWADAFDRWPPQPRHAVGALLEGLADAGADREHADALG